MNHNISKELFDRAKKVIPGGVNSPVRAYGNVGITPPFIKRAFGSKITDADGNEYIDYIGSWGPMILGHANEHVIEDIIEAVSCGTSYGAPTKNETELAELICDSIPSIEMIRMVNSGTEAVMSAIRVARAFTKRDKILKFEGCYHGHSDGLLVKAGSGALTTGTPNSAGVPIDFAKNTLTASYNNFEEVEEAFKNYPDSIAAIIVEPVAANMGVVPPTEGFLKHLREICTKNGSLLIFDEVITGFRLSFTGAQGYYSIQPDLTTFGKIIGGGLPVGAYGGRKDIMSMVSPIGPVYQAGTLAGNPVAMVAGIKTLSILKENKQIYFDIEEKTKQLEVAYINASKNNNIPISINRVGSIMSVFFTDKKVTNFNTALTSNTEVFTKYFKNMLLSGIYIAPSQFEALFMSYAHSNDDILNTINIINNVFTKLKN